MTRRSNLQGQGYSVHIFDLYNSRAIARAYFGPTFGPIPNAK